MNTNDADAIRKALSQTPKRLPTHLLYDALGSALFEAITHLPEYGVTQAGLRLLERNADEIVQHPARLRLVELGPGAGTKGALLMRALVRRQPRAGFVGVDVSAQALLDCERTLRLAGAEDFEGHRASYLDGLGAAAAGRRGDDRWLVLFLGSNLSNFDRAEAAGFVRGVRQRLRPGDRLLLGVDLEKPEALLLPAYDDALGVTAAFDKNLLVRLNREYGANFDVKAFRHRAVWNQPHRRVEMHLVATRAMHVRLEALALDVHLAEGEHLWTESSHRFGAAELRALGSDAGLRSVAQWIDDAWPFAQTLYEVQ